MSIRRDSFTRAELQRAIEAADRTGKRLVVRPGEMVFVPVDEMAGAGERLPAEPNEWDEVLRQ